MTLVELHNRISLKLRAIALDLIGTEKISRAEFALIVNHAMHLIPIMDEEFLAREFGCTKSTINRWRAATATPAKEMRAPIFRFIWAEASKAINKKKENASKKGASAEPR